MEALRGVVEAGLARQGLGLWWAGRLGLLLIPALFSPSSTFSLPRDGSLGGAGRICFLLAGFAGSGGGEPSGGLLLRLLLAGVLGATDG